MTKKKTLPDKPRRQRKPVLAISRGVTSLKGVGKRTFNLLRGSYAVREATVIAIKYGMVKLLDPKGPCITALSKNRKIGYLVKTVVAVEGYQILVDRIAESTAGLAGKGFKASSVYTVTPEEPRSMPEKDVPVLPTAPMTQPWTTPTSATTVSFKGKPVQ